MYLDGARHLRVLREAGLVEARHDAQRRIHRLRPEPLADLPGHGSGWQVHAEDLRAHVEGREPQDWRRRWLEPTPAYEALRNRLSIEETARRAGHLDVVRELIDGRTGFGPR